jgi:hypothetical protein
MTIATEKRTPIDHDEGTVIATATSQNDKRTRARWSEFAIVRLPDGLYRVEEIGRSAIPGEKIRRRSTVVAPGVDVIAVLTQGTEGKLSKTAERALLAAAEADPGFAAIVEDVLPEDLTPGVKEGDPGRKIVLQRTGKRPVRFHGWPIGHGSSHDPGVEAWTAITLYRTVDGRIVGLKKLEPTGYSQVAVAGDAGGIIRAFTRPGVGWVESALVDAIDLAREHDAAIDNEIAGAPVADWAHAIVGSTSVRPGDARFRVLEELESGATLYSWENDDAIGVVGLFARRRGTEERLDLDVTPTLFLALSRQRLIVRDRKPHAKGWIGWTISPKGRDTVNAARSRAAEQSES